MSKELSILLVLAFAQFTNIVDFMIMMPLGPEFMKIFNISATQFSILVSVYSFSAGLSALMSSFFIDDYDRKKSFLVIYFGFLVGTLCCAISPTYELLLVSRVLTGMFGGIIGSQVYSIVGDLIPFERRGRATGIVMGSFSLASIFGVPGSLYLATLFSWHAPFIFLVIVGSFLLYACNKMLPEMNSHRIRDTKRKKTEIYQYVFANKHLILTLFLFPFLMLAHFTIIPLISTYMVFNIGFTNDQVSYIYFFGGLFTVFSSPFVGKMIDKFGAKRVYYFFGIAALPPMYALINLPQVPVWVALIVTSAFFVLGSARNIPALSAINSSVPARYRGGFMSLNTAFQSVGTSVSAYLAGILVNVDNSGKLVGYDKTIYIILAGTVVCFYIFSRIRIMKENIPHPNLNAK